MPDDVARAVADLIHARACPSCGHLPPTHTFTCDVPSDTYYEALGEEIDLHPIGIHPTTGAPLGGKHHV